MLSKCLQIDFKWLIVKVSMFLVVTLVIFIHVYIPYCKHSLLSTWCLRTCSLLGNRVFGKKLSKISQLEFLMRTLSSPFVKQCFIYFCWSYCNRCACAIAVLSQLRNEWVHPCEPSRQKIVIPSVLCLRNWTTEGYNNWIKKRILELWTTVGICSRF